MASKMSYEERIARGHAWIAEHKDHSPEELAALMTRATQAFRDEVSGLSDAEVSYSPGNGQWSVREVCLHVDHAIGRVANLVPMLASGTVPDLPTPKPGVLSEDPGDYEAIIGTLVQTFERAVSASTSLEDSPDLDARFDHPFFGPLNCREWMAFNVMHLNIHTNQVRRVKKALGESKTGG